MNSTSPRMTLIELYRSQKRQGDARENAEALLKQTHWFTVNVDFDPKTGEALPQALSAFLARIARMQPARRLHDRLWRITEHARSSVERLFRALSESPRREHAMLPVRAVRELDANSFIKLSNRPGRTIREKVAGKPYLQAVRRFQSVNLPENRLLKAFVMRLAELLELRRDCLSEPEDELLPRFDSWLLSDEAKAIDRWDNLPPNNTLLSHRDYRRIWDSWRWLQTLDDDIARDFSQLEARDETMRLWNQHAQRWANGGHRFAEMPVLFDYEKFEVRPWAGQLPVEESSRRITRRIGTIETLEPVCVDLTLLRPCFATATKSPQALRETYMWQTWKNDDESVDIDLFTSDAVYLHRDANSICSADLFFEKDKKSEHYDRAARVFVSKMRDVFKSDKLIWLVPDFLNDFELEVIRRNLNARFAEAEPLPRSVAAVFEHGDPFRIAGNGYAVVVVDTIGNATCATKLLAKFDERLANRVPETRGYYWERCPPVIITGADTENVVNNGYDIATVDARGQFRNAVRLAQPPCNDAQVLKRDKRIGNVREHIMLTESPVAGGSILHALQQRAGDIPLWRDQIPELSIKVMKDGRYQRFHLVSRGRTVKPIRGLPISIPVDEDFTLPAGKPFYQFPLFQGENAEELGFSARLESPAFPLKDCAVCQLNLTFEYGADEPYKLVFTPLNKSFPPVRATWRRTEEAIITDAPAPEYPTPMLWADLRHFPDNKNGGTMDLVAKMIETSVDFARWIERNDEEAWNKIEKSITGWCRFLVISIWRDGRSATNAPLQLRDAAVQFKSSLSRILAIEKEAYYKDVRFLECCMHKDAPDECVHWIIDRIQSGNSYNPRAVGFALGDVSEEWQQYLFDSLASKLDNGAISVFAYAIWRERHFVERFSISRLQAVLNALSKRLCTINLVTASELCDSSSLRDWARAAVETLELLLGLLRTRASSDPEIKMLLQPHQRIAKELAKQVERVADIVAQAKVPLFSRVQLNLQKPQGDRTPDLLYALRLYLTGDDGAHAIHVASISDTDDE